MGAAAIGVRYRLVKGQGGGCVIAAATVAELVDDLRRRYGARLVWVELPDGERLNSDALARRFAGGGEPEAAP
jgi:hypothetical protein